MSLITHSFSVFLSISLQFLLVLTASKMYIVLTLTLTLLICYIVLKFTLVKSCNDILYFFNNTINEFKTANSSFNLTQNYKCCALLNNSKLYRQAQSRVCKAKKIKYSRSTALFEFGEMPMFTPGCF